MRARIVISLLLAACFAAAAPRATTPAPGPDTASPGVARKVVAYYFHGTQRCKTCLHIESTAKDVMFVRFGEELKAGRLEWRVVDIDRKENGHFVEDYGLVSSSVVLVEFEGPKQVRFKVLDRVWRLSHDDSLADYIRDETVAFLNG